MCRLKCNKICNTFNRRLKICYVKVMHTALLIKSIIITLNLAYLIRTKTTKGKKYGCRALPRKLFSYPSAGSIYHKYTLGLAM